MKREPALIEGTISTLGEGPVWLKDENIYYWVDIIEKQIRFYNPRTGDQDLIQLDRMIGAAVPADDGRFVCAMQDGFYFLDRNTKQLAKIVDPESELPDNRFNDGKCDSSGRFWAGTMSVKGENAAGAFYCLEKDGTVRKIFTDISCSNGVGWSPDDQAMYYIDTGTHEVHRMDYEASSGKLGHRKAIVTIPKDQGVPDGMCVDAEGMIWVAHWGGYCITRWNPSTGEQLEKIELPVSQVTSCCFGGEQLDELFITSAREGLSEEQLSKEPLAGSCFKYKPGVRGLQVHGYRTV
ncbi:SMP-30/gluconolactonase/LRE family protein [Cohnella endophytica]|uniref:Regucalcin n=1 Tax=Cohnella endophytica TaxID=2419778 RepID=A0A494Y175_9BACL|nr:SMP-30/gluconolactonase/LRE family protein [Cohnella endophytica]RKP54092.1 SMP-30/gluconolactonase/LRE family protein [Cohnella endophytica]